jgi:putative transposase
MNCHVIFSTKNREPLIMPDWTPRLFDYIGGIVRENGSSLIAAGGMPDHVHLLVSLNKQMSIADMVRDIKSNSSRWIHETFDFLRGFAWQTGYGAFAISHSNLGKVKLYLTKQPEHHRLRTFQEEFIEFLRRHQIEFDEQFIWS